MGFFSWRTQDTDKSISNIYSTRPTFQVQMMDDKGNVWTETDYEGYGVFGKKDYYELLAEMNGIVETNKVQMQGEAYTEYMRQEGIRLAFDNNPSGEATPAVKYPNLVETAYDWKYDPEGPESCREQGFFYDDSDEDAFDEWSEVEDL